MSRRYQIAERKLSAAFNRCGAMAVAASVVCNNDLVVCDMHFVERDKFGRIGFGRLIDARFPRMGGVVYRLFVTQCAVRFPACA